MVKKSFNPLSLEGKKILVTGASSGLGRATSIYLTKLGAQLVLVGRNEERLNATLNQFENPTIHQLIIADLADIEDMTELFNQATVDGVKLNGLVHAAGIAYVMPLKNLTRNRLLEAFNINYFAFIELCRQYSKPKYSNGGSIVGISSIAADTVDKCQTAYSATKAAMDVSVKTLALELTKKNIRINTVLPGMIHTEIIGNADLEMDHIEKLGSKQLMGIGEPNDVAGPIAFLLSDMAKFITGRQLFIDGGRLL